MPRHLTPAEVDAIVAKLHAKPGEWISRGRAGEGFMQRDGQLYRVYVEEHLRDDVPVTDAALRAHLLELDLDNYTNRYEVWALQQLGFELPDPQLPG